VMKKSCVHIVQPDGKVIPFEAFNLFYRDDRRRKLEQLRAEAEAPYRSQRIDWVPAYAGTTSNSGTTSNAGKMKNKGEVS